VCFVFVFGGMNLGESPIRSRNEERSWNKKQKYWFCSDSNNRFKCLKWLREVRMAWQVLVNSDDELSKRVIP
jgi:hypothetical protein